MTPRRRPNNALSLATEASIAASEGVCQATSALRQPKRLPRDPKRTPKSPEEAPKRPPRRPMRPLTTSPRGSPKGHPSLHCFVLKCIGVSLSLVCLCWVRGLAVSSTHVQGNCGYLLECSCELATGWGLLELKRARSARGSGACMYMRVCVCVYVRMYIYIHIYMYICTHMYICI